MKTTILVAGGVLALAACGSAATAVEDVPATTTTEAPTTEAPAGPVTDDEIDLIALDTTWSQKRAEICPLYRDALATGVDPDVLEGLAVRSFADGWGDPLSPAVEARLIELINEC